MLHRGHPHDSLTISRILFYALSVPLSSASGLFAKEEYCYPKPEHTCCRRANHDPLQDNEYPGDRFICPRSLYQFVQDIPEKILTHMYWRFTKSTGHSASIKILKGLDAPSIML